MIESSDKLDKGKQKNLIAVISNFNKANWI